MNCDKEVLYIKCTKNTFASYPEDHIDHDWLSIRLKYRRENISNEVLTPSFHGLGTHQLLDSTTMLLKFQRACSYLRTKFCLLHKLIHCNVKNIFQSSLDIPHAYDQNMHSNQALN